MFPLTPEQKESYESMAKEDRDRWQREKAAAEKPKDPLRPKRPPSAYFLFLNDFRSKYTSKTDPAKEITKKAGAAWNVMTEEDKKPYQAVAAVKRQEWENALKEYKIKNGEVGQVGLQGQMGVNGINGVNGANVNGVSVGIMGQNQIGMQQQLQQHQLTALTQLTSDPSLINQALQQASTGEHEASPEEQEQEGPEDEPEPQGAEMEELAGSSSNEVKSEETWAKWKKKSEKNERKNCALKNLCPEILLLSQGIFFSILLIKIINYPPKGGYVSQVNRSFVFFIKILKKYWFGWLTTCE